MVKRKIDADARITGLRKRLTEVLASFNVLFQVPGEKGLEIISVDRQEFLEKYLRALLAIQADLEILSENPETASRRRRLIGTESDSIDYINFLTEECEWQTFGEMIEASVLDVFVLEDYFGKDFSESEVNENPGLVHQLRHADRICNRGGKLIEDYLKLLNELDTGGSRELSRVSPESEKLNTDTSIFKLVKGKITTAGMESLLKKVHYSDPFRGGRAFRYIDGSFFPANLTSIRPVENFYGYHGARRKFKYFFSNFSSGETNLPLLISSLPGLGKTHFAISHALHCPNLTLILPEPGDLEKPLEGLIRRLARRKNHRFVLFFDDIDTREVNWYYFRTNVGGSFVLPDNIMIVIATNYEFPANISSRGVGFAFPIFDEVRCEEMVYDYLITQGMRKPAADLVSVISADYVEEFGQKMFEELSPRTLVRYLERFNQNAAKRKRMLELSREQVVTRPDAQLFYEFNIRLIRSLHGDEAIDRMRQDTYSGDL